MTVASILPRNIVVALVARLTRRKVDDLRDHVSLGSLGLGASIGLVSLRSSLERETTTTLPPLDLKMKISDLVKLIEARGAVTQPSPIEQPDLSADRKSSLTAASRPRAFAADGRIEQHNIGIDIQDIDSFPVASDYRDHEFYSANFLQSELATAMLRADLRSHLAGVFCAKEAAKKTHPVLLNLRLTAFCVVHDPHGAPLLRLVDPQSLPIAFRFRISISHAQCLAAANCLTFLGRRSVMSRAPVS